jgi:hypothetical protein
MMVIIAKGDGSGNAARDGDFVRVSTGKIDRRKNCRLEIMAGVCFVGFG